MQRVNRRRVAGQAVHHAELEARIIEQQRVVLAMHVDEPLSQLAQLLQAHGRIVHEGAGAPTGIQLAAQDCARQSNRRRSEPKPRL